MFNIYNFFRDNSYITDWISFGALLVNIIVSLRIIKRVQRFQSKKITDVSGEYVSILSSDEKESNPSHTLLSIQQHQKDIAFDIDLPAHKHHEHISLHARGMIDDNKIIFGRLFKGLQHEKDDIGLFRLDAIEESVMVGSMYIQEKLSSKSDKKQVTLYKQLKDITVKTLSGIEYETSYQKEVSKNLGPLYIKHSEISLAKYRRLLMMHPVTHQRLGLVVYEMIDRKVQGYEDYFDNLLTNSSDRPQMLKDIPRAIVIHLIYWYNPYHVFALDHLAIKQVTTLESKFQEPYIIVLREKIKPDTDIETRFKTYGFPLGFTEKKRSTKPLHDLETSGMTCPLCRDVHCNCYTLNYFMINQASKKAKK